MISLHSIWIIIFEVTWSYLTGRLHRNRLGHLKLTNRIVTEQILPERMCYQHLVSTLLTQSFGNHLFAHHLVLKHPHTNMTFASFCISKSRKKYHKKFENQFKNENLTPKNDLELVFYMCKGGNPKILN